MKKLIYLILISSSLFTNACKKDNTNIIEGYFYEDCSKTPTSNFDLKIYAITLRALKGPLEEYLGEVKTDVNGYFKFEYEGSPRYSGYDFKHNNYDYFSTSYEKKTKFCAFKNVETSHNVILKVDRPFSNQDTLYFGAVGNSLVITLIGPLNNGQKIPISIRPNFGGTAGGLYPSDRTGEGVFWWGIGAEEYEKVSYIPTFQIPPYVIKGIPQNVCGQGGDITIDLRGK